MENADAGESFIGNAATELFNGFVRHAWVQNEIMKGHPLASLITKDTHAGWDFHYSPPSRTAPGRGYYETDPILLNTFRKYNPAEAAAIPESLLRTKPFHTPFKYSKLYNANEGSAEGNKKQVQHELLAAAIPAMSYAAAANPIEEIERKGNKNFNMMAQKNGGWPRPSGKWQHSDFRDVAFSYVVPMFQEMINQGKLDE